MFVKVADAVVVARSLGATLVLPDIRGSELGEKRFVLKLFSDKSFLLDKVFILFTFFLLVKYPKVSFLSSTLVSLQDLDQLMKVLQSLGVLETYTM